MAASTHQKCPESLPPKFETRKGGSEDVGHHEKRFWASCDGVGFLLDLGFLGGPRLLLCLRCLHGCAGLQAGAQVAGDQADGERRQEELFGACGHWKPSRDGGRFPEEEYGAPKKVAGKRSGFSVSRRAFYAFRPQRLMLQSGKLIRSRAAPFSVTLVLDKLKFLRFVRPFRRKRPASLT